LEHGAANPAMAEQGARGHCGVADDLQRLRKVGALLWAARPNHNKMDPAPLRRSKKK